MTFIRRFRDEHNKYKAKSTVYDGRVYHSKREAEHAMELDMLRKASRPEKRVRDWQPQYVIDVYMKGREIILKPTPTKLFRIIPDFLVTYGDDHEEVHEVKGYATDLWRFKWKILEAVWNVERPEIDLIVIR